MVSCCLSLSYYGAFLKPCSSPLFVSHLPLQAFSSLALFLVIRSHVPRTWTFQSLSWQSSSEQDAGNLCSGPSRGPPGHVTGLHGGLLRSGGNRHRCSGNPSRSRGPDLTDCSWERGYLIHRYQKLSGLSRNLLMGWRTDNGKNGRRWKGGQGGGRGLSKPLLSHRI